MRNIIGRPQKVETETLFTPTKVLRIDGDPVENCIGTFEASSALEIAKQLRKEGFRIACQARGPRKIHAKEVVAYYNQNGASNFDIPLKFATKISLYVY